MTPTHRYAAPPLGPCTKRVLKSKGNEVISGFVYILASKPRGTLYVGVTSNLAARIYQHKQGLTGGFAAKYGCATLVWAEKFPSMVEAIANEKRLKRWHRRWKFELIEKANPDWKDLYDDLI